MTKDTITSALFKHEMQGTSKVFGRSHGISIVFEGSEAKTDGKTIYYPAMSDGALLSTDDVMIGRGFVDHEAAHIRHTDMAWAQACEKLCNKSKNNVLKSLTNAIEDVRIEAKVIEEYPGSKKNLTATSHAVNKKYLEVFQKNNEVVKKAKKIVPIALTWQGRKSMGYAAPSIQESLDTLPEDTRKKVEFWASKIPQCTSVQDSYDLACKIFKELGGTTPPPDKEEIDKMAKRIAEGKEKPDKKGQASPGQEGEGGEGEGSSKGTKDGKTPSIGRMHEEIHQMDDSELPLGFDLNGAVQATTAERNKQNSNRYIPLTTRFDRVHHFNDPEIKGSSHDRIGNAGAKILRKHASIEKYNENLRKTGGKINVMRRKLELAIQSKRRVDWDKNLEQGRLDNKKLIAAYGGKVNIFKMKVDAPALDTAIGILVDHSGSMGGDKKPQVTVEVATALYEVFQKIGVPFEIVGFNNGPWFQTKEEHEAYNRCIDAARQSGVNYSRLNPMHLYVYKAFNDKAVNSKAFLPSMPHAINGDNADGDAVLAMFNRLKGRPEKRKILLVLSDGQPASATWDHSLHQHLRFAVDFCEKNGVETIGIGIMDESVKQYYPKFAVCHSLDDLPKSAITLIAKALLKDDRYIADNADLVKVTKGLQDKKDIKKGR